MNTSDWSFNQQISPSDKKLVDDFIGAITRDDFSTEHDILGYMATKLYPLCNVEDEGYAPFSSNYAIEYMIEAGQTHDVKIFHEELMYIVNNARRHHRYICNNIRYSFTVHETEETDRFFGKEKVIYVRIHCNSSNAEFLIRVIYRHIIRDELCVNVVEGHSKKSFQYGDIRDDKAVLAYETKKRPVGNEVETSFEIDGQIFKYRFSQIKTLGYCMCGCYLAMKDEVELNG